MRRFAGSFLRRNLYPMNVFEENTADTDALSIPNTARAVRFADRPDTSESAEDSDAASFATAPPGDSDVEENAPAAAAMSHSLVAELQAMELDSDSEMGADDLRVGLDEAANQPLTPIDRPSLQIHKPSSSKKPGRGISDSPIITDTELEDSPEEAPETSPASSFTSSSSADSQTIRPETQGDSPAVVTRIRFVPKCDPNGAPSKTVDTSNGGLGQGRYREHYHVIAHSPEHQEWFDKYNVPWAVQYQLAVLLCLGRTTWGQITGKHIKDLRGTNAEAAPRVISTLAAPFRQIPTPKLPLGRNPWIELDKEEAALSAGTNETLGLLPPDGSRSETLGPWWGGKVEQRAVLIMEPLEKSVVKGHTLPPKYSVQLRQHEMKGKSFRLARKFGSRRFISLKLPELKSQSQRKAVKTVIEKGLLLCGRVFRAFSSHEGLVRFIETDENVDRDAKPALGDELRLSFPDFVAWFNPLGGNLSQPQSKWSSRFTLGLSTSVPGCVFKASNIFFVDDIVADAYDPSNGIPESKHIMTDGCGRINRAALRVIQQHRHIQSLPTAVQGRVAGAKGLWVLDTSDFSEEPKIWITKSQVKIRYARSEFTDPSKRILDVLRIAQIKTPVRLGMQPIINFSYNGVDDSVFNELLQESLKDSLDHLFDQWNTDDTIHLWDIVFSRNGVGAAQKQRRTQSGLKEFGLGADRDTDASEDTRESDELLDLELSAPGPDPKSGWPSELAEQVVALLQAKFLPRTCPLLAGRLKTLFKQEVDRITSTIHITVKHSAEAFAIPDFSGTLEEGEVFFKTSNDRCGLVDHPLMADGVARGALVIFRYPCRTPSDARLVKAVDNPKLYGLTDVLVFSTKGHRSGASILAGGDYDGDTVHMVNDPRIVEKFVNSSLKYADPPEGFDTQLVQVSLPVRNIFDEIEGLSTTEQAVLLQKAILATTTRENFVGLYSTIADLCVYRFGYADGRTIHATYAFFNELDAIKSGRYVCSETYQADSTTFGAFALPDCFKKGRSIASDSGLDGGKNLKVAKRPSHLKPFILDNLIPAARAEEERYYDLINKLSVEAQVDLDLLKPLLEARQRAKRLHGGAATEISAELELMSKHVDKMYPEWSSMFNNIPSNGSAQPLTRHDSSDSTSPFFFLPRRDQIRSKRKIAERFNSGFDPSSLNYFSPEDARRILAALAYDLTVRRNRKAEFAFTVAFRWLAALKVEAANAGSVTIAQDYVDCMVPRRGLSDESLIVSDES